MAPIVFVGIVGNNHAAVEHQLEPTLDMAGITEMAIPDDERAAIVKHTKASKQVVKSLHVGGVVAGQLGGSRRAPTFRVVIYDADGNLTSDLESPISRKGLTKHNLEMFAANVADLAGTAAPDSTTEVKPDAKHDAPPVSVAAAHDDDDTASAPAVVEHAPLASHGGRLFHVRAGVLVGVVGRNLASDPNTVQTYTSAPVGTGGFEAAIGIGERMRIAGSYEHTLVMHTAVGPNNDSTAIARGEVTASYDVVHGAVEVAPVVGVGTRFFSIDDTSGMRSPDTEYVYAELGASIAKPLGKHWALRGLAAFEPVVGGIQPAKLPAPSRWGFDVGAALEVHATHVFARAAFDYQSFASAWSMLGNATDAYPTGTFSAGAAF